MLPGRQFPKPEGADLDEFIKWDDWRVLGNLANGEGGEHGERLCSRNHYREIYHTPETPSSKALSRFEKIRDKLGDMIKAIVPSEKSWYKVDETDNGEKEKMNIDHGWRLRLAVLAMLVKRAKTKPGRTALMKFAYILQTVKKVPLGYNFELYNYGPYDSAVLSDLSQAETLKAIKSQTVMYPSGLGYEYATNNKGYEALFNQAVDSVAPYQKKIDWVLEKFGNVSASRLELISTIVFAEREMRRKKQEPLKAELCRRVKGIKPHFSDAVISEAVDELSRDNLISPVSVNASI